MKNKYSVCILAAGCLWGFMGLFRRQLGAIGVSSMGLIVLRCGLAALFFAVTILVSNPKGLRVKLRDFWCFVGSGICSLLFFSYCYFQAMTYMSLSAAAILLYTAPSIVMVLSLFLFKEKLSAKKGVALGLAFIGCALVSGVGNGDGGLTFSGVLYGLGAGFGYALYSIFARLALDRGYSSSTVNFYSCLLAGVGALIIAGPSGSLDVLTASWGNALFCVAAAFITCYLPYLLYTYGLTGMEAGRASIMASVEPVVATLVGVLVFHEGMTLLAALGVVLVLSAVVILNRNPKANAETVIEG